MKKKDYLVPSMKLHQLKMTNVIAATIDAAYTKRSSSEDKNNIQDFTETEVTGWQ